MSLTDSTSSQSTTDHIAGLMSRWSGRIIILIGLIAISGWFLELRSFVGLQFDFPTMKMNTAILFLVSGLVLQQRPGYRKWYLIGGTFILLIASLTFIQYVFHFNAGIDELFIRDRFSRQEGVPFPGRMSPATAINFMIYGTGVLLVYYRKAYYRYCVLAIAIMALLAMSSYLYNSRDLADIFFFSTMALHTALSFFLLSIGLLFTQAADPLVELMLGKDSAGYMIRRLLPSVVMILMLSGFLFYTGQRSGLYGIAFTASLMVVSNIVIVGFIVYRTAFDLQRLELDLRHSELQYRTMLEKAAQGVILVDAAGQIVHVNAYVEDIFCMSREELIGSPVDSLIPDGKRNGHEQLRAGYMTQSAPLPMGINRELEAIRGNGTLFPVEISLSPIDIAGEMFVVAFIAEISNRKKHDEEQIRARTIEIEAEKGLELQELKSRFVTTVSHQFRTPLAIMMSSVDLIQRYSDKLSQEQMNDKLDKILHQINRVTAILSDVIDRKEIESGAIAFQAESIDLPSFTTDIIEHVKGLSGSDNPISVHCDEGAIVADPDMLRYILSNLLLNSLHYSDDDSAISLNVSRNGQNWQFTVQDHGIGIPESEMKYLFQPFYRASNVENMPGIGLTLSIVKHYVGKHQGHIEVSSIENEGTTVRVFLPVSVNEQ